MNWASARADASASRPRTAIPLIRFEVSAAEDVRGWIDIELIAILDDVQTTHLGAQRLFSDLEQTVGPVPVALQRIESGDGVEQYIEVWLAWIAFETDRDLVLVDTLDLDLVGQQQAGGDAHHRFGGGIG